MAKYAIEFFAEGRNEPYDRVKWDFVPRVGDRIEFPVSCYDVVLVSVVAFKCRTHFRDEFKFRNQCPRVDHFHVHLKEVKRGQRP